MPAEFIRRPKESIISRALQAANGTFDDFKKHLRLKSHPRLKRRRSRPKGADLLNAMRLNFCAAACRNEGVQRGGGEGGQHIIHFLPFHPRLDARAKLPAEERGAGKNSAGRSGSGATPGLRSTIFF